MVGKHGLALKSRRVFPNEFAISPTNAQGVYTIPAPNMLSVVLGGYEWSYSAAPTNGRIRILSGGQEFVNFDVTAAGEDARYCLPPIRFPSGQSVSLIIDPGGIGVIGKIRPHSHWVE